MTSKAFFTTSITTTLIFLSSLVATNSVLAAPRLYLEPSTISVKKDQEFSLTLKIDVEDNQSIGSDISLNFAGTDQELVGVDNANFFPEFTWASAASGKIEIHAFSSSIYQTKTGQGTLATLKFRAKKESGSSTLSFECSSSGNNTNILSSEGNNLLACGNLNQTLITYTTTTTTTSPSPSPSLSPTPSPSSPATSSPKPPICTSLSLDPGTAITPKTITLTCHGYDNDSDITSAEFNFGDGTSQSINKNIGGTGSISTTHSYTKSGSLKATCKLKDSDRVSNECSSSLTLTAPLSAPKPSTKPKASPSPTAQGKVLSLVAEPSPTPTPAPTYSPAPTPSTQPASNINPRMLWLILGLAVLVGIGGYSIHRIFKSLTVDIPPQTN